MAKGTFHLVLGFSLFALVRSQTSSLDSESPCGYIEGDVDFAVGCSSQACGLLSIFGHDIAYAGCCGDSNCVIPTTCIQSGTASDSHTAECTDESLSACATYTWPELSAEGYFCALSRTTATVVTKTTTGSRDGGISTSIGESSALPSGSRTVIATGPPREPQPTTSRPESLGTEHDLSSRQRIGAGVGSGVSGGLLLIFFAIFGCCRRRRRRTGHTSPQHVPEVAEPRDVQAPAQAGYPRSTTI